MDWIQLKHVGKRMTKPGLQQLNLTSERIISYVEEKVKVKVPHDAVFRHGHSNMELG